MTASFYMFTACFSVFCVCFLESTFKNLLSDNYFTSNPDLKNSAISSYISQTSSDSHLFGWLVGFVKEVFCAGG